MKNVNFSSFNVRTGASRLMSVLGLTLLCGGLASVVPARADDDHHDRHDRMDMRYDEAVLRRERAHLRDLKVRRDDRKAHHDWDAVHRLDKAIAATQWRIDHRKFDTAHDWDSFYSDSDRDWFRHHH